MEVVDGKVRITVELEMDESDVFALCHMEGEDGPTEAFLTDFVKATVEAKLREYGLRLESPL